MRILYGPATSPFVRKVWMALEEKRIPFERRELDPLDKSPRLFAMNPLGRVPILEEEDGTFIADSSVICDYLEHVQPEPALYPRTARERARALWLEEYGDTRLVEVCARLFWMRVIIPARTGHAADEVAIGTFQREMQAPVFDFLETISPNDTGIIGGRFGIADIALAAPVRLLDLCDAPLETGRWPRFEAYYRRIISRPSARGLAAAERAATEVFRRTGNPPA